MSTVKDKLKPYKKLFNIYHDTILFFTDPIIEIIINYFDIDFWQ